MKREKLIDGEVLCMFALAVTILIAGAMNIAEQHRLEKERRFKACPICGAVEGKK